jgi:hypothetical protein
LALTLKASPWLLVYSLTAFVCFWLSLLLILYFAILAISYVFSRKLLGPTWLVKGAVIILILIIISYLIFPELAFGWGLIFGGGRFT